LEECGLLYRVYGRPAILASIVAGVTAAAAAAISREAGSSVVVVSLAGYLILSLLESPWRLPFLVSAATAHAVNVALHYSNPIPLPLFVVERAGDAASLNLDIVQVALLAEASLAASAAQEAAPARCGEEIEGEGGGGEAEEGGAAGGESGEAAANAPEGGGGEAAVRPPKDSPRTPHPQ
jgi:hypothetical protein